MSITKRRVTGSLLMMLYPDEDGCMCCYRVWKWCRPHTTFFIKITDGIEGTVMEGCHPLCQECWNDLTPESRLPYYQKLLTEWQGLLACDTFSHGMSWDEVWNRIQTAVLAGE